MKLGSHNTLTYLRPRKWWLIPLHFMARCQGVDYREQYERYGVRLFDLRIWFDDDFNMEVRHGVMVFMATSTFVMDFLQYLNDKGDCCLRVILEEDSFKKRDKYVADKEDMFKEWCRAKESEYPYIKFFGGNRKWDWKKMYHFRNQDEPLDDRYSSTTSLFKSRSKWLAVLDDLCPWLYARIYNRRNFNEHKDDGKWLFVDFVEMR